MHTECVNSNTPTISPAPCKAVGCLPVTPALGFDAITSCYAPQRLGDVSSSATGSVSNIPGREMLAQLGTLRLQGVLLVLLLSRVNPFDSDLPVGSPVALYCVATSSPACLDSERTARIFRCASKRAERRAPSSATSLSIHFRVIHAEASSEVLRPVSAPISDRGT